MSLSPREFAAAVARSTGQRAKPLRATSAGALTSGYLRTLKARGAEVGVWEIRGRVFARVMVAARDAKLSGAEWGVLTTIALHLQHLGRSKGMMSLASIADDNGVTERTVRNALRVLVACRFAAVKFRASGQITIMLDRRFGPRAPVPGNLQPGSPRRSAARKKISTNGNSSLRSELPLKDECTDSAPSRRESPAFASQPRTANGFVDYGGYFVPLPGLAGAPPLAQTRVERFGVRNGRKFALYGLAPPRKRAPPVASG